MGTLVSVAADNLGSHQIGGFKGSCTAARPCRHCSVAYEDMKDHVSKIYKKLQSIYIILILDN